MGWRGGWRSVYISSRYRAADGAAADLFGYGQVNFFRYWQGGGYGINLVTRQLLSIAGKFELPRRFPLDGSSPFILVCSMDILYRA